MKVEYQDEYQYDDFDEIYRLESCGGNRDIYAGKIDGEWYIVESNGEADPKKITYTISK